MATSGGQYGAPVSGAGTIAFATAEPVQVSELYLANAAAWGPLFSPRANGDGFNGDGAASVGGAVFNGATWDRQRTPLWIDNVATAATGSTALHTPAAGKKFRIMRYLIHVTANAAAAAAAAMNIRLLDAATGTNVNHRVFIPNAAGTTLGGVTTGWIDLGNGYLSVLANNVLNVDLSFALTAGVVNIVACGTEE